MGNRFPYIPPSSTSPGCALSLLSSEALTRWVSPDFSYRSSAALRELIAENRATLLSRQMLLDRESSMANQTYLSYSPCQHQVPILMQGQIPDGWENFRDNNPAAHVTLDLMQVPSSSYDMLSAGRSKSKEDEECCDIWKSFEESHVV